jgi:multisubunit Na+/H+ antiporter MnhB subunit
MIWLTWRQFRASAVTVFGVLGAVAVTLALTGPRLHREYADLLAHCGGCTGEFFDDFSSAHSGAHSGLLLLVIAVPAVVGVFWGAPLISREYETGTQDLVWQQSVPRRRWLAVKLGLVGPAAIAAAALAVVPASWYSQPLDATALLGINRLTPILFDARGYVVLGHTAFAFTLGAAAGLLIRRTVPAMAVTFAIFIAAQIVMPTMVRPHLTTPVRLEAVITAQAVHGVDASGPGGTVRGLQVDIGPRGAWILTNETVDSAGRTVHTLPAWVADCDTPAQPAGEITQQQCLQRLTAAGYRQAVTYHPADRFWLLQAYETAIFGLLSLLLVGFCFLRIRPR